VANRAHASVAHNDGVQPAQSVEVTAAGRTRSRNTFRRCAIEHHDDRTVVIVMLATELEQVINGRARDAALLHPRLCVSGNVRFHRPVSG